MDVALSFIRTVTVGFGVEPNLLTPASVKRPGARGLMRLDANTAGGEFRPALRTLCRCKWPAHENFKRRSKADAARGLLSDVPSIKKPR
jgi:hypothetical protein